MPLRLVVVVPVFNHGLTVRSVVSAAGKLFPVIAINDGSTDETATELARVPDIKIITSPLNCGKAAALKSGFSAATRAGFTHALTLDADGQHPAAALPSLAALASKNPGAIVAGVRDLRKAQAPFHRRASNALSTFWFRFETRLTLPDTQCGLRVYPLAGISHLQVRSSHYAYELELLVRAAWAGIPIVPCPFEVDYRAPTSRLSHFHPLRDFSRVFMTHSRLALEALSKRQSSTP